SCGSATVCTIRSAGSPCTPTLRIWASSICSGRGSGRGSSALSVWTASAGGAGGGRGSSTVRGRRRGGGAGGRGERDGGSRPDGVDGADGADGADEDDGSPRAVPCGATASAPVDGRPVALQSTGRTRRAGSMLPPRAR